MNAVILGYIICILVSVIVLLRYCCSKERYGWTIYLFIAIIVMANVGYLALGISTTVEEAILAHKVAYMIGIFVPMLTFFLVCEICQVRLNNYAIAIMHIVQIALYVMVWTIGYSDIYYKTAELQQNAYGISYLVKGYGVMHFLYPVSMYGYFLACMVVAITSLFRASSVSYKNVIIFILAFLISLAGYVIERVFPIEIEIVPFVTTIMLLGLSVPTLRMNNYYIKENIQKSQESTNNNIYIAFNTRLGYLGSNDKAKDLFPELAKYKLDHEIPYSENMVYQKILPMVQNYVEDSSKNEKRFELGYVTYDCIVTPIKREEKKVIGYLVELEDVTKQLKNLELARDYNRNLENEVLGKTQRIREIQDRTILGMAQMVESRDLSTGGHIKRTSSVVNVFARELLKSDMDFSPQFLSYVEKSAPMHDLGKIAVDDEILRKPGKYTEEEYSKMKAHSSEGARVVREILTGVEDEEFMNVAINVAHFHHEKMDGTGYPKGLKGEEIPIEARIMALADVFDALVSKRCYKEAFSYDKAFSIIEESAGSHFDPNLAKVFVKCRPQLEALYHSFEESV